MSGKIAGAVIAAILAVAAAAVANGQTRKSVSASEVTGTFSMPFGGKFKGSSNEVRIRALGNGRLRVAFDLIYPYVMRDGGLMANTGEAEGEAAINGDAARFSPEDGRCSITIKFVRPGMIRVDQEGTDADCGFGANVSAAGTYRKISGSRPKF